MPDPGCLRRDFAWRASSARLRASFLALLMGCGGGATEAGLPERDVSLEAVGVEGEAHVRVGALALRVPAEALGVVQARWAEARFELGPAPMGASAESLAAEEARALSALHPDAEIGRSRARFVGRPAIRLAVLREGEVVREVLVALRSPWRKARVVVDGGGLDAFLAGRQLELAGLALGITAPATLELAAPRWSVRLAEAGGGAGGAHRRCVGDRCVEGRGAPEALEAAWPRVALDAR